MPMDVDETKESAISGDVLIVETQQDGKLNNSFSSLTRNGFRFQFPTAGWNLIFPGSKYSQSITF